MHRRAVSGQLRGRGRSKYGAQRTTVDGWTFDSKREAARYQELLLLGRMGVVRNLELQPKFPLVVNGERVATYIADFRYEQEEFEFHDNGPDGRCWPGWHDVVEDLKGMDTPVSRLKRKLVAAIYDINVRVTR